MKKNPVKIDDRLIKKVISVAAIAGRMLCRYQKKVRKLRIESKDALGVVSEADLASEKLIQKKLKKLFPAAHFMGEEGTYNLSSNQKLTAEDYRAIPFCWCVDPLDGTTNFLAGFDYYAVCIALLHYGVPVLGVVYRPSSKEHFHALKGKGAVLVRGRKRQKINMKLAEKDLKSSLLVTGFSAEKADDGMPEFVLFRELMLNVRGVRRMGAAALDLCYTAQGPWDGFWEKGLAPWDVAAAGLICQESGVVLTDFVGQAFNPFQSSLLAARPQMHKKLLTIIAKKS